MDEDEKSQRTISSILWTSILMGLIGVVYYDRGETLLLLCKFFYYGLGFIALILLKKVLNLLGGPGRILRSPFDRTQSVNSMPLVSPTGPPTNIELPLRTLGPNGASRNIGSSSSLNQGERVRETMQTQPSAAAAALSRNETSRVAALASNSDARVRSVEILQLARYLRGVFFEESNESEYRVPAHMDLSLSSIEMCNNLTPEQAEEFGIVATLSDIVRDFDSPPADRAIELLARFNRPARTRLRTPRNRNSIEATIGRYLRSPSPWNRNWMRRAPSESGDSVSSVRSARLEILDRVPEQIANITMRFSYRNRRGVR